MAALDKGNRMLAVDIVERDIYVAMRSFILGVLPGIDVIQGYGNGTPMPKDGFICMTLLFKQRLATNIHDYDETTYDIAHKMQCDMQIDCYGLSSGDWAALLTTLLRDDYATSRFPANIQPLYCDDARQMDFENDSQQYENRWMFTSKIQFNPVYSRPNENI